MQFRPFVNQFASPFTRALPQMQPKGYVMPRATTPSAVNFTKRKMLGALPTPDNWGLGDTSWNTLDEKAQYAYTVATPEEQTAVRSAIGDGNNQLAANVLQAVLERTSLGSQQGATPPPTGSSDPAKNTGISEMYASAQDLQNLENELQSIHQSLNELKALDDALDKRVTAVEKGAPSASGSAGGSGMPLLLLAGAAAAAYYFTR